MSTIMSTYVFGTVSQFIVNDYAFKVRFSESNDAEKTKGVDWTAFKEWLNAKYDDEYAVILFRYARKHWDCFVNPSLLLRLNCSVSVRNNVVKALIALSKFLGCYEEIRGKLKICGVKFQKQNSIESFLRILRASESDVLAWYDKAYSVLDETGRTFLELMKESGIRYEEGVLCFNLIIDLAREGNIGKYYDKNLGCLTHFKYPKKFLRGSKNVYISFVPESLVNRIAKSQPLGYFTIRKRLNKSGLNVRINELRDWFGTYLLQKGVLKQEIDMLQGRIPSDVFIRHYWSPKLKDLSERVLNINKNCF